MATQYITQVLINHFIFIVKRDNLFSYFKGFETFYLVDKIIDPGFKLHRTCAQLSTHMMLHLGESSVLPFTTEHLLFEIKKVKNMNFGTVLSN